MSTPMLRFQSNDSCSVIEIWSAGFTEFTEASSTKRYSCAWCG